MPTNMSDVAARAGVSQRTVSNVVSGYVHVRPQTRERVQQAIEELNYRPNASARSLRLGRTGIIGLAVPEIASPYFAELADHIQRVAASLRLTLLMDQTGGDRDRELLVLRGYGAHVIDGLILSPMAITLADLQAQHLDIPAVLLGEGVREGGPLVRVAIDDVAAAREATRHLLDGGRNRLAALGADIALDNDGTAAGRLEGFMSAHRDAGLQVPEDRCLVTGGWVRSRGYAAVSALLDRGTEVDGLLCFNDLLAAGALRALADHGVQVPADIAVVGWDNIDESSYCSPSLTSVAPDKAGIAEAAVHSLVAQIAGEDQGRDAIRCGYRLEVRESSAMAGRAGRRPGVGRSSVTPRVRARAGR